MYWTLELASKLEDAPWPATKEELIDYATRSGAPLEVLENLQEIEDEGDVYESIEDIWPDYPSRMTSYGMTTNIKKVDDRAAHLGQPLSFALCTILCFPYIIYILNRYIRYVVTIKR